jgi:hypothetical protein
MLSPPNWKRPNNNEASSKLASVETRASVSADASGLPPELVREALTILVQREFADLMKGSRWAPVLRGMGLEARLQFETQ